MLWIHFVEFRVRRKWSWRKVSFKNRYKIVRQRFSARIVTSHYETFLIEFQIFHTFFVGKLNWLKTLSFVAHTGLSWRKVLSRRGSCSEQLNESQLQFFSLSLHKMHWKMKYSASQLVMIRQSATTKACKSDFRISTIEKKKLFVAFVLLSSFRIETQHLPRAKTFAIAANRAQQLNVLA